mmetsp:Transcript_24690/g.68855  ORF Transcript_24690/g.68855 Transcript_24690/m.68855 type:complete len:253 (+) Transcript_24690:1180-1938(+)
MDFVVVAAEDHREEARLRERDVVHEFLVRQRYDALDLRMRRPNLLGVCLRDLQSRPDRRSGPTESATPIRSGLRDVEAKQCDLHATCQFDDVVLREVEVKIAHIRVDPRSFELRDAALQREVRNVRLVVPEADRVHRDGVHAGDHASSVVHRREQRRRNEVAGQRCEHVRMPCASPQVLDDAPQSGKMVKHVHVVDMEYAETRTKLFFSHGKHFFCVFRFRSIVAALGAGFRQREMRAHANLPRTNAFGAEP